MKKLVIDNKSKIEDREVTYNIKGYSIVVNSPRRIDTESNEIIYDYELDNNAMNIAIQTYNKNYGIEPEEIKSLREKYSISIDTLAKVIGCAKKTLISYEKGNSVPNDIYRTVLHTLVANPHLLPTFAEENRVYLTDREKKKIFNRDEESRPLDGFLVQEEKTIYNGYTSIDMSKVKNLIMYFARKGVNKTKLAKLLFYVDFKFYKEQTVSVTGMRYKKLAHGPVPERYFSILETLESEGYIDIVEEYSYDKECLKVYSIKKYDLMVFDDFESEVIEEVEEFFGDMNSSSISEYSHKEKAWLEPQMRDLIHYNYALELNEI